VKRRRKRPTIWKWLFSNGLMLIAIVAIAMLVTKVDFFNEIVENNQNTDNVLDQSNKEARESSNSNNNAENDKKLPKENEIEQEKNDNSTDMELGKEKGSEDTLVNEILNQMDLHQKICQMFIVFVDSLTGVSNTIVAGNITQNALEGYPVGGLLYQVGNLSSDEQVTEMIQGVQSFSNIPLFIASDEEGGRVARVMDALHPYSLEAMLSYKDMGKDKAYKNAATIADSIGKYGFNTAFAPVADVWSNPENIVIGDRAYSDDFEQASELISAAVQGFKEKGMICTLKHFPGHGDTKVDSHYGAAYVTKSIEQLRKEEFLPFKAGIDSGADMVMIGHLIVPDIDEVPATFSRKIVSDILIDELNFNGVIITDALNMQAISDYYDTSYTVVNAVKAGVDILLCPSSLEESVETLVDAVQKGDILEERIDESIKKILTLKLRKGIIIDTDLSNFQ
jgi:beta-N-acetylhexosaminidase